jgi:eukaryotic-like serine/threonine-protein kinase
MSGAAGLPSRIGPYPVEREVGRGGMGIVYLGRDTRLDRPVAIKLLPEAFAQDPERLARFEREARLLASLTHPNIAGIYGLEEHDRHRCLVLEYVEGETLAARLARGPLPVDEAVEVCRQVAAAVEAAHESGVIHRDLKPGNVMLTPAGAVKVLDFGLARGGGTGAAASSGDLSASPTMAHAATEAGVILGTAAYMSPEQARARPVDRRTDIWSFGCVLYECLSGRQAFAGETVSDMIALILQGEPDWKALPRDLPPALRGLLERCLTKDPKKRLRDIGEARLLLESSAATAGPTPDVAPVAAPPAPRRAAWLPWTLAAAFALATAVFAVLLAVRGPAREPVQRVSLAIPPTPLPYTRDPAFLALSPDGTMLAAGMADSTGGSSLWLRPLDAIEGRPLPGTDDAILPFWSPDGRYVAFSTQDKLKKLDLRGGSPEVLCPIASYGRGGSWSPLGVIVFSGGAEGPLYKVSQDGGTPQAVTKLAPGETGHRFPRFLPDGKHFLFAAMPPQGLQFSIYVGSTDSPQREKLMTADGTPVYVEPGYLLYGRNGRLVAQRFDAARRKLAGEPIALVDEPERTDFLGSPNLVAGLRGGLGYYRRIPVQTELAWLDAGGNITGRLPVPAGTYESAYLSPDGKRAAVVRSTSAVASDLWMVDLERGTMNRFTFGPGRVDRAVWSPDGSRVAYASDRSGRWDIYEKSAGGGGPETPIVSSGSLLKYPNAYTPDGRALVFEQITERNGWDMWQVSLDGDRKPQPLLATPYDEQHGTLSRDGKWLAFVTNESGRAEVYVQDYPTASEKHLVSSAGGAFPRWRADGRELLFLSTNGITSVDMVTTPAFRAGTPRVRPLRPDLVQGDVLPDFSRILGVVRAGGVAETSDLTLVLNWRSDLARK